jgi:hypothetical protein
LVSNWDRAVDRGPLKRVVLFYVIWQDVYDRIAAVVDNFRAIRYEDSDPASLAGDEFWNCADGQQLIFLDDALEVFRDKKTAGPFHNLVIARRQ